MHNPRQVDIDADDAFERGRQRGAEVGDELRWTWPVYQQIFAVTATDAGRDLVAVDELAESCLDSVASWSPGLLREVEGIAAGSGADVRTVMAINARTEILARARGTTLTECSTIVELRGTAGSALGVQTWDWHHDLADAWHLQTVAGDEYRFVGLTEFGMPAKIGVNSAGLGLHFNLLRHESDVLDGAVPGRTGGCVPVHLLAREILGRAASVTDAVEIARSAPLGASTVLTVFTADEGACVEVSPAGVGVVEPEDGWLVHTNHFLDPRLADGERVTVDVTTTFDRQDLLRARVKGAAGPLGLAELVGLLCAHDEDGVPVCRHLDPAAALGYRSATLATVALDAARREAHISAGGPCRRSQVTTLSAAPR